MNFLSHYYFDRDVTNCYHILGIVLPDLLKNADKTIVLGAHLGLPGSSFCECHTLPTTYSGMASKSLLP